MNEEDVFILERDTLKRPYTAEVAEFCSPFSCRDEDLDEFFAKDAMYYDSELLGRTYAWIDLANPRNIMAMVTLSNDSVKAKYIANSARNRIQRGIVNAKRGINYPAFGVSSSYRGKGLNIGSKILDYIKEWFRSIDNKTGCRFIVVDAYNNDRTLNFYKKNGFKLLYKTEDEEREFLELDADEPLKTRFMFFDLKQK